MFFDAMVYCFSQAEGRLLHLFLLELVSKRSIAGIDEDTYAFS